MNLARLLVAGHQLSNGRQLAVPPDDRSNRATVTQTHGRPATPHTYYIHIHTLYRQGQTGRQTVYTECSGRVCGSYAAAGPGAEREGVETRPRGTSGSGRRRLSALYAGDAAPAVAARSGRRSGGYFPLPRYPVAVG